MALKPTGSVEYEQNCSRAQLITNKTCVMKLT